MISRKIRFALALVLTASMFACGCGSADSAQTTAAETETAVESTAAETAAAEESQEGSETAAETEAALEEVPMPDFSTGLTENGDLEDTSITDTVTLPDYKHLTLAAADVEVTDEEVQAQIDELLSEHMEKKEIKDREVKDGDTVNIDYVGSVDGVEFEGGNTNGAGTDVTIGVTQYIDDFLEQLIGHKPGETFDVNVTFPDPYNGNTELSGKDAVFVTTINYIVEEETPELTDVFVAENLKESYGYESVEDMKTKIRENLQKGKYYSAVWQKLLDESEFSETPDAVTENQMDIYLQYSERTAYNYNMTLEDYLAANGLESVDDLKAYYHDQAEQIAKQYVITQKIADELDLQITDEEMAEYFGEQDVQTYRDFYGPGYMRMNLRMSRIPEIIMETAELTETPTAESEAAEETAAEAEAESGAETTASPAEETTSAE